MCVYMYMYMIEISRKLLEAERIYRYVELIQQTALLALEWAICVGQGRKYSCKWICVSNGEYISELAIKLIR